MAIPALAAQQMMAMFRERQRPIGLFSSMFLPRPGSTGSTGSTVMWDIERYSDQIPKVVSRGSGMRINTVGKFSSKEIEPADYGEAVVVNVNDLVNRLAGENPFDAATRSHTARFMDTVTKGLKESARLIARGAELQASQVLQTGTLNLSGNVPYIKDFKPKTTHFPTVGTAWSVVATATPMDDLQSLCEVIMDDSKAVCTKAFMGSTAIKEFMNTDQVKEAADLRRINLMSIDPDKSMTARGAKHFGTVQVGQFELELWGYNEKYEPHGGGSKTAYLDPGKVILLPDDPALVVASTIVPHILPPDPRIAGFVNVPTTAEGGWDLTPNVWADPEGAAIYAGFYASFVMIPQGIDEFGCMTT